MSRIGTQPISISEDVVVTIDGNKVTVKGQKGELEQILPKGITAKVEDNQVIITRKDDQRQSRAFHGLSRSLVNNMVTGVSQGYVKKLKLVGTGYRAKKQGDKVVISVGYSHPIEVTPKEGLNLDLKGDTTIIVSGVDKQKVGHLAAEIRAIRKPEPYKGKGIRYDGEIIRRKAGKAAKVGGE